jgi:repressor LexA
MHEAVEQTERIDFSKIFDQGSAYVLEVSGDSMIDAQIADGDYVVVRKARTASAGQMVVARTEDGEATLKFWHPEKNRIRLQPANSKMRPIYSRDARVIGVVIGVVRKV